MSLLSQRLKRLREELDNTQEQMGGEGFVSTPGWIKLENGQRLPSDKLIDRLVERMVRRSSFNRKGSDELRNELLTLKYLGATSPFVRELARVHAQSTGLSHLLITAPAAKAKRGRPARKGKAVAR